jgi:hypothetical protein
VLADCNIGCTGSGAGSAAWIESAAASTPTAHIANLFIARPPASYDLARLVVFFV